MALQLYTTEGQWYCSKSSFATQGVSGGGDDWWWLMKIADGVGDDSNSDNADDYDHYVDYVLDLASAYRTYYLHWRKLQCL